MQEPLRFGKRLRALRQRTGMTQAELSDVAGVARSVISNLETDLRGDITLASALRIARALGVSVEQMVGMDVLKDDWQL